MNQEKYTTAERHRIARALARRTQKRNLIHRSSIQAKAAKARLINSDKGRNGVSMSTPLLIAHLALV